MTKNKTYAVIIGLLISLSAFAEGMYRDGSQFVFMILVSILFSLFIITNKIDLIPRTFLDWFVIACIPVYIIASFDAVSLWDSMATVGRYLCCYFIYFMSKEVLCNNRLIFYRVIFYVSTVVSLYGLWLGIKGDAFETKRGLLLSVFGYHNVSAVFFAVAFLLGMYLAANSGKVERILISVCNTILIFSIIFSQSRGAWLVFLLCVLGYIILSKSSSRFSDILISAGAPVAGAVICMRGFSSAFALRDSFNWCEGFIECFIYLGLSILISVLFTVIFEKTPVKKIISPRFALYAIPLILIFFLIFIMVLAPTSITERIKDFSFSSSTVSERQLFFKDAMRMFAANPVNGVGGNCWQYVYPSIQQQFYTVAHPHNFFAEMTTDAGIFGALLYVFMIFSFVFACIKKRGEDKLPAKFIGILIILHTIIDFDTDYFTILTLLFTVFAIISSGDRESTKKTSAFAAILPLILFVWAGLNGMSMHNYNKAIEFAKNDVSIEQVYSYSKRSTKFMPLKSDYLTVHGNVCVGLGNSYLEEAEKVLNRSLKLNKYHYETITQLSLCYLKQGDYKACCDNISKLVNYQPFIPVTYTRISDVYSAVEKYGEDTSDLDCIIYACKMLIGNLEYAYAFSEKMDARIEIFLDVREKHGEALDILKKLEELGVET